MSDTARRYGWRPIALVVAGGLFMLNLDSAIIATSLPQVAGSFHRRPIELSIAISAYILAGAAVVPLSGWLADRLGARRVLLAALFVFTAASLACGLATAFVPFVLARIVQGAGGAVMVPVGQAVVLRATDRGRMIQAIGLVTWPSLIAPVLGPALGGFITTYLNWRWNFWLNLPLGIVLAILVQVIVPDYRAHDRKPLDTGGLALTSLAMVCLLAGLDSASGDAARPLFGVALVIAGLGLGVLAVRHLRRHAHPVLSLLPMRARSFALAVTGPGILFRGVFAATPFLLPLLFQIGFHLSAVAAGLLVLVYFAGNLWMKLFTTRIMQLVTFRSLLIGNGIAVAATVWACGTLDPHATRAWLYGLLFLAGVTRSLQFTALTTLGYADIEPAQKNDAATLSSLIIQGTFAAGIAVTALGLNLAQARHPGSGAAPGDFRLVFDAWAFCCLAAAAGFVRLPHDAGDQLRSVPAIPSAPPRRG